MLSRKFYHFILVLLVVVGNIQAQEKRTFKDLLYADAKVGWRTFSRGFQSNNQITSSVGYRISQQYGLDLSYRSESSGGVYESSRFHGAGANFRYKAENGLIFKVGGGSVLSVSGNEEYLEEYEYAGGGYFMSFSLDYQIRNGITCGIYYTDATMSFEPYDGVGPAETYSQRNFGVSMGFAVPWHRAGQDSSAKESVKLKEVSYADFRLGLIMHPKISGSIGGLINEKHGIGIRYHWQTAGSTGIASIQGIGAEYRYATNSRFILKAGIGSVLAANHEDYFDIEYEYMGGGHFASISLDYQLRNGITFGAYYSHARRMSFRYYEEDFSIPGAEPIRVSRDLEKDLTSFGITVGFSFPRQKN